MVPGSAYSARGSRASRAGAALLAVIVAALIVLLLILSGLLPRVFVPVATRGLSTFDVRGGGAAPAPARAQRPAQAAKKVTPPPPRAAPPVPKVAMPVQPATGLIPMSDDDFAASDIGRIRGTAPSAGAGQAAGADSAVVYGPGDGPGGRQLYAAEWVREPTRAELAFYMPAGVQEGWGMIACRTVPRNRVEDCRVLGESPGSGIGRGLREAAWQFLVLPPRIDGKPMIGAWVRIRFDLVRGVVR